MHPNNLIHVLRQRAHENSRSITFIEGGSEEASLSYRALYEAALQALHALQARGLQPGHELVFQVNDNRTFLLLFWACVLGGMIPVPLTVGHHDEHRLKLFRVWPQLHHPHLVTDVDRARLSAFAGEQGLEELYRSIEAKSFEAAELLAEGPQGVVADVSPDHIAFIQFSSGSTGQPKGVVLTHRNLLVNMAAISRGGAYTDADSTLSWMPLTHDMGLIGFHLNPLLSGMDQYLMPSQLFVRRPSLWLTAATRYKVSILCSPNFGYAYLLKHCPAGEDQGWDLSSVRLVYNGAEPISLSLCRQFAERMKEYGLRANVLRPVYGLAEASLAVTMSHLGEEIRYVELERSRLNAGDRVSRTQPGFAGVSFVNVGRPVQDCALRIADVEGEPVQDEVIGRILIKGDNVTSGYYNDPVRTAAIRSEDGWLDTGDLGFVEDGCLYITGRAKDIIFINGQNYYPHDLESIACELDGVELNKAAMAAVPDTETGEERVVAFVLHRGETSDFVPMALALRRLINERIGIQLSAVVPVRDIPRTTSGKLQRFRLAEQYRAGVFTGIEQELSALILDLAATGERPQTEAEQRLAAIWQRVLNLQDVGIDQSFFELGGNSLKAAELAMAIWKDLGKELPLRLLYEQPTIRTLALALPKLDAQAYQPMPPAPESDRYAATSAQRRLYHAWQADKDSIAYNVPLAFELHGTIDTECLRASVELLVQRHEVFRARFDALEPRFTIRPTVEIRIDQVESDGNPDSTLRRLVRPFDLANDILLRFALVKNADRSFLFVDAPHIIADGLSLHRFTNELIDVYEGGSLPAPAVRFRDYATWENGQSTRATDRQYWTDHLAGELPVLQLPADRPRPALFSPTGARIRYSFDAATTGRLRALAAEAGTTLHTLLYTLYCVCLHKHTGQKELVVGIPISGRYHPDAQVLAGMFVNNLARYTLIDPAKDFRHLLREEGQGMREALDHAQLPFEELLAALQPRRDPSRNPLFDTMFIYQDMGRINTGKTLRLARHPFDPGFSKFDLSLEVIEDGDGIEYAFEYATALFDADTIGRFAEHFALLTERVLDKPSGSIAQISVLSENELHQAVRQYNRSARAYPFYKTIHQLFAEQAERTPAAIAIRAATNGIDYAQLLWRSGRLAAWLQAQGVGPNTIVAVVLDRSAELVVALMAVLRAGGAYLPVDTGLPDDRIRYMLGDSRCGLVLTDTAGATRAPQWGDDRAIHIANLDRLNLMGYPSDVTDAAGPQDLAYVIYTSGSTGRPKGVMIAHRSLVNYASWAAEQYVRDEAATFPLFTSPSFDLTVTALFPPLITGNTIVVYGNEDQEALIQKVLTDNQSTVIKLTPAHLRLMAANGDWLKAATRLRRLVVGGEQLPTTLARTITEQSNGAVEIINEYGPTEATVGCMIHSYRPGDAGNAVPIGLPAANTQIYLLDAQLQPVPIGVSGEIYIAGDGLAKGYLFNEQLTEERFIPDPFAPGWRMYRTGDHARRLTNGLIEYIGRTDEQVKINGFRIELQEIAARVQEHEAVNDAVVIVHEPAEGQKMLRAYYTGTVEIPVAGLRAFLATRLPHYMMPAHFTWIEKIPLTRNGKVDLNALPKDTTRTTDAHELLNDIEQLFVHTWADVLDTRDLSIDDNFFELGGDSIKALQIVSRLRRQGLELQVKDILTYHTIRDTARHARQAEAVAYDQRPVEGALEPTPIARWFFDLGLEQPGFYNQSLLLDLQQEVDIERLSKAFQLLIAHHDGLRLNYDAAAGRLFYNKAHLADPFVVEEYTIDATPEALERRCQELKGGFDLRSSLLFEAAVLRASNGRSWLFLTAHHLIVDGITWRILLEDLHAAYTALTQGKTVELPPKTASLLDWSQYLQTLPVGEERAYWEAKTTHQQLPLDGDPAGWLVRDSAVVHVRLDRGRTGFLLHEAAATYKTDVPVLLNAALALTLREWTGESSFAIEQEGHGRHAETINLAQTAGWFTAIYPVEIRVADDLSATLRGIKEELNRVPGHGLGYLLLRQPAATEGRPATEVRLNYLGQFGHELRNELFAYSRQGTGPESAAANRLTAVLEINALVAGDELEIALHYNGKAHAKRTMEALASGLVNKLEELIDHLHAEADVHLTPSDFPLAGLNAEDLDLLFSA